MKKSQIFNPDVRNMGGRKILVDQLYNHQMQLGYTKPLVGSLQNPPQIESFGTINDRRKKIYDFIAYPPKFFRRLDKNQMNQYNQMIFSQRSFNNHKQFSTSLQKQNRPKTAQTKNNCEQEMHENGNIYIQDSKEQRNEYPIEELPQEQYQQLLQNQIYQLNINSNDLKNQQLIQQQEIDMIEQNRFENQSQAVKKNLEIYSESGQKNINNSLSSGGNTLISPSITAATAVGYSSAKFNGSPPQNEGQFQNKVISQSNNFNVEANKTNSLFKKQNNLKSSNNQENQSNNESNQIQDKTKKSPKSEFSKKNSEKSLRIDQENIGKSNLSKEQKWITIIEEIPVLLDANEESLKALQMHLINLIIEFRLYKIIDYENMKEIFIQKNKDVSIELVNEIFKEIVDALNE